MLGAFIKFFDFEGGRLKEGRRLLEDLRYKKPEA